MTAPTPSTPSPPEQIDAARAAVLAYRKARGDGLPDYPSWRAARSAVLAVLPEMGEEAAGRLVVRSVAYAASQHSEWFWRVLL